MFRRRPVGFALLLIVVVAVVFIAPSGQLEPTAMRAWLAASALFLAIAGLCHVIAEHLLFDPMSSESKDFQDSVSSSIQSTTPLDLNCARLC
jgi:hypothetical protein